MSLFEFITGMISVLLALCVAQLLLGVARLVQNHARVRTHLPHTLWNINIFLLVFLHWWSLWDFRSLDWTWPMFFYSLMGPTLLFFAATLVSPQSQTEGVLDLRAHFRDISRIFLLVFLVSVVFVTWDGALFGVEQPFNRLRALQLAITVAILAGIWVKSDRAHTAIATLILGALSFAAILRYLPGAFG